MKVGQLKLRRIELSSALWISIESLKQPSKDQTPLWCNIFLPALINPCKPISDMDSWHYLLGAMLCYLSCFETDSLVFWSAQNAGCEFHRWERNIKDLYNLLLLRYAFSISLSLNVNTTWLIVFKNLNSSLWQEWNIVTTQLMLKEWLLKGKRRYAINFSGPNKVINPRCKS